MNAFLRYATLLVAAAAMCQAGFAQAEVFNWSSGGQTSFVGEQKAAVPEQAPCGSCCEESCCGESCDPCCCRLGCDACPNFGILGFAGFDAFKGVSDGSYPSNFGALAGLNAAMPIPGLRDYGLDWQLGMSYGVYDFDGRNDNQALSPAHSQQQIFLTTGFFHKAQEDRRVSFGLVYDWMINDEWGVYGTHPTIGQWRGQIEYALSGCNAVGLWGSVRDLPARQRLRNQGLVTTRAISQVNLFWHHKFCSGADSWLWVGFPENERLSGQGSLGTWMIGANVQVPLSERLALYGNGSYFRPSNAAGPAASVESGYDVGMGIVWYFGRNAVSHAINGKCNMPYMPVANNSNFLVDQHPTYYP